jgi:hypothetical protein
MRRFYPVLVSVILLQACSSIPFLGGLNPPTNTATLTATSTVTFTPTITSTATITPSVTPTTTIVRIPTQDPNLPTATFVPIPILVDNNTITPFASPTEFSAGPGFLSVSVSEKKIFWGSCKHNKTKVTAQVMRPDDVFSVVIFVRAKALNEEDYTPWTTGDVMHDEGQGLYSYTLVGSNIEGHNHNKESWVIFQLVATDVEGDVIGNTMVFTNSISLSPCM